MKTALILSTSLALAVFACGDNETPAPEHPAYVAAQPAALPCVPNLDGKIDASELAPILGIAATYLVSPAGKTRTVDLVGAQNDGKLSWDFGIDFQDDQVAKLAASSLDGKWYASSFTGLDSPFVTAIDAGDLTEGVYTHTDAVFQLHGIASSTDGPNKTLLVYTTPIDLYRFPIAPGASYSTTGEVQNGTFRGLPYAGRDTYDVKIDAAGEVTLPDFTLTQAIRVKTKVTVAPSAGEATTQRQTSFLFECLGEVVRATSNPGEPNEDFTVASELRRLGLAPQ